MGCASSKPTVVENTVPKQDNPGKTNSPGRPAPPMGIAAAAAAAAAARSKKMEGDSPAKPTKSDSPAKSAATATAAKSSLPSQFSPLGVHFSYVYKFMEECGGQAKLKGKTTRQVVRDFIEQKCKPKGVSIVNQLHQNTNEYKYVGKASLFVSHSWDYRFLDVVDAISRKVEQLENYNEDGSGGSEVYIWIDIFSLPQLGLQCTITESKELSDGFVSLIRDIGTVVMVLTPYMNATALSRSWCVFELYACVKSGSTSNFDIALTTHDVDEAIKQIMANMSAASSGKEVKDAFEVMLDGLDTETAKATFPHDKEIIDKAVKDLGGYKVLNKVLKGKVQKALGREAANERMVQGRKFEINSQFKEAVDKYEEAVAIREFFKLEKPTIVSAMIARARAHYEMSGSDAFYTEVFEVAINSSTERPILNKVDTAKADLYKLYLYKNSGPSNGIKVLLEKCGYEKFSNFAASSSAHTDPAQSSTHTDDSMSKSAHQPPSQQGWVIASSGEQPPAAKSNLVLPPPRKPLPPEGDKEKPTTVISEKENSRAFFCC